MQYLQRSTKQEVLQLQRNWQSCFTLCGEKKSPLMNSRMQQLSTYSKGKGILKSVTIIEASRYCQLLERSLLGSYWTDWTVRDSTRKPVWIQEKQRNNRHDLHSTTASRKMPGTECGPLYDPCRPYQSIWHSQLWGSLENYGKVWLYCLIHSNGAAVPWWYACKGPKWWRVFWSISCDKWSQARLCTSFNTVQHDGFCHAYRCFPGWWQWYTY